MGESPMPGRKNPRPARRVSGMGVFQVLVVEGEMTLFQARYDSIRHHGRVPNVVTAT